MTAGGARCQALIAVGNSLAGCATESRRQQAMGMPKVFHGGHAVGRRAAKIRLTLG